MREDLPKGWVYSRLDQLATVVAGNPAPQGKEYFHSGEYNFVRVRDMGECSDKILLKTTRDLINDKAARKLRLFPSGSILFTKSGASTLLNQRVILAKDSYVVSHIAAAIPFKGIETKWIFYFLKLVDFATLAHATNMPSLPLSRAKAIKIPVAPINEQYRTVAKIEELFSALDKGIESLKTAREQLKVYRQAILKHAFEGKLTEYWRAANKDNLETIERLLARIRTERDRRYQQQIEEWNTAVRVWESKSKKDKKPSKPRRSKPFTLLQDRIRTILPDLPDCWVWGKLGWMTCGVEYGTSAKSSKSGTTSVLRMGNLQNCVIDWSDLVFSSDPEEIEKFSLTAGDVLFNRTNSPELVGKTAIYRGERPALFAGYLIRINHIQTIVDSQYLNLFLNSHLAKQFGNSVKTDGVNQSNINGEKLKNYPFPYCSLAEQKEIVRILDEKLSLSDHLLNGIDSELAKSSTLRQSILKMAFSGQLVAQDINDEPSSTLLERIRAEKAEQEKTHRKNSRRKTGEVIV